MACHYGIRIAQSGCPAPLVCRAALFGKCFEWRDRDLAPFFEAMETVRFFEGGRVFPGLDRIGA
jgi:hypothetical protein